jgi:hypothetical protein
MLLLCQLARLESLATQVLVPSTQDRRRCGAPLHPVAMQNRPPLERGHIGHDSHRTAQTLPGAWSCGGRHCVLSVFTIQIVLNCIVVHCALVIAIILFAFHEQLKVVASKDNVKCHSGPCSAQPPP